MIVVAERGDRCDAEVTAINPGKSVSLSLESAEPAILLWSGLEGNSPEARNERGLALRLGSTIRVDVIDVHLGGDMKRKILVREVVGRTPSRPAHRLRREKRQNRNNGVTYKTRDGIRVWRAS